MSAQPTIPLYTPEQQKRRDESHWTLVQGILAPVQFVIFLVSIVLVLRYLLTGEGYAVATWSVLAKTLALYTIMVTGALWEKEVFGQYLLAPAFYWEDMVSFGVIALHTLYLAGLFWGFMTPVQLMILTLVAYVTYAVNAAQFLWKLRLARLSAQMQGAPA
jgi:3-vinyl bacteriochlorophyllide hydratase